MFTESFPSVKLSRKITNKQTKITKCVNCKCANKLLKGGLLNDCMCMVVN